MSHDTVAKCAWSHKADLESQSRLPMSERPCCKQGALSVGALGLRGSGFRV